MGYATIRRIEGQQRWPLMRVLVGTALLLLSLAPSVAAIDYQVGNVTVELSGDDRCSGTQGDAGPIHHSADDSGEYIALNRDMDKCTLTWTNPGQRIYIGPCDIEFICP